MSSTSSPTQRVPLKLSFSPLEPPRCNMVDFLAMESPIGALAADMGINFSIKPESSPPHKQTPRRCLFDTLKSLGNNRDNREHPKSKRIFSRVATADPRLETASSSPLSSPVLGGTILESPMGMEPLKLEPAVTIPSTIGKQSSDVGNASLPPKASFEFSIASQRRLSAPSTSVCNFPSDKPSIKRSKTFNSARSKHWASTSFARRSNVSMQVASAPSVEEATSSDAPSSPVTKRLCPSTKRASPMELDETNPTPPCQPMTCDIDMKATISDATMRTLSSSPVFQRPCKIRRTNSTASDSEVLSSHHFALCESTTVESCHQEFVLPHIETGKDALKRIDCTTLARLINGDFKDKYDELHIVDCRFPYEFNGGHINGATNINSTVELERKFLGNNMIGKNVIIVLHCEFSESRAPRMAQHLRNQDRQLNLANYPKLYYPHIYILKGGYRAFFGEFKQLCNPQAYIQMDDPAHRDEFKSQMNVVKRRFEKSRSCSDILFRKR